MVYAAIDSESKQNYTYLKEIFSALENRQRDFNWLITDCEVRPDSSELDAFNRAEYSFISGDKLTEIVEKNDSQWIWGVLCGFEKDIPEERILGYELPKACDPGFWRESVKMQHSLSTIEIVAFDSSSVLLFSSKKEFVEMFRKEFPECEDLREYNRKN